MSLSGPRFTAEESQLFAGIMRIRDRELRTTKLDALPASQKQRCMQWVKSIQEEKARRQRISELEAEAKRLESETAELEAQRRSVLNQYGSQAASQLSQVAASGSSQPKAPAFRK